MQKLPSFKEFVGLDKFVITQQQINSCYEVAKAKGRKEAIEQAKKFEYENARKN